MELTIDASQFLQLADVWKQAPELTQRELLRAVTEADVLVQGELQQHLPMGAGGRSGSGLVGGVHHEESLVADGVLGMVAESQPYGAYVEVGTKPHKPPIQPLMDWIEAVIGLREKEAKSMAFAIRNTIGKRGTHAQPVWQQTYNKMLPKIQQLLTDAVQRVRDQLAGGAA